MTVPAYIESDPQLQKKAMAIAQAAGFSGEDALLRYSAARIYWDYPVEMIKVLSGKPKFEGSVELMGNFGNPSLEDCYVLTALTHALPPDNLYLQAERSGSTEIYGFSPGKEMLPLIEKATLESAQKIVADAGFDGPDAFANYLAAKVKFRSGRDDGRWFYPIERPQRELQIVLRAACYHFPELILPASEYDVTEMREIPVAFEAVGALKDALTHAAQSPAVTNVTIAQAEKIAPTPPDLPAHQ